MHMKQITAAKLTEGMKLDAKPEPALITKVARSQGGIFAAKDQVIITLDVRGHEFVMAATPGQRMSVVA